MGTSNMDPTTKYFYSNAKVVNMEEDSEGKCYEKAFETLPFLSRCKCVRKNLRNNSCLNPKLGKENNH
jgi:hypothetical protein